MEQKVSGEGGEEQEDTGTMSPKLQKQMSLTADRLHLLGQRNMARKQVEYWVKTVQTINTEMTNIDSELKDLAGGDPEMCFETMEKTDGK